jgi:ketosteroid isomerase-like protein
MSWKDALRTALPPAAIALAVTLVRLAGELGGWSEAWFSRATGGLVPASAVSWVVGITWLALPFGAWFAWRLARAGVPRPRGGRALLIAVVAIVVLYGGGRLVSLVRVGFPAFLLAIWSVAVLAAIVAWQAWPALGRVLLVYGLLSRAAVAVVMFFAMRGQWGTHYDYADSPGVREMSFGTAYVALALVPQLVFWVGYTVARGMLAGAAVVAARATYPEANTVPEREARNMKTKQAVALAVLAAAVVPLVRAEAPDLAAGKVRAREAAFAKTMADRDLAAFAPFVAKDAVFLGKTALRGRPAVVEGWKALFEGPKAPFSWQPDRVEVIESGRLALSTGPVFDPQGERVGTFNSTWRLDDDGEWRVVLDSGCPPCKCP